MEVVAIVRLFVTECCLAIRWTRTARTVSAVYCSPGSVTDTDTEYRYRPSSSPLHCCLVQWRMTYRHETYKVRCSGDPGGQEGHLTPTFHSAGSAIGTYRPTLLSDEYFAIFLSKRFFGEKNFNHWFLCQHFPLLHLLTFLHHRQHLQISLRSGLQPNQKSLRFSPTVPTSNPTPILAIPTWLLKECSSVLIPTITNIVNLSLSSDQFHPLLKQSTISPLLKKPTLDKDQLFSYRPIWKSLFTIQW